MNTKCIVISLIILLQIPTLVSAGTASILVTPSHIIQGDPLMITIESSSTIKKLTLEKVSLKTFLYKGVTHALYGVDLKKSPGTYVLEATFYDGTSVTQDLVIEPREKIETPFSIPEKLGGNTSKSQKTLISTLKKDNQSLLNLRTEGKPLWSREFLYPVKDPIVTDVYGYTRATGAYSVAHKGTDFHAKSGTKVFAMNRGIVRVARAYRNYGKTIVIDHGLGVMTMYMHLSKLGVKEGVVIKSGQLIGLSGMTGYAESPHLHLSIRINDVSVDPIVFLQLFK